MQKSGLGIKLTQTNGNSWNKNPRDVVLSSRNRNFKSHKRRTIPFIQSDKANKPTAVLFRDGWEPKSTGDKTSLTSLIWESSKWRSSQVKKLT